MKKAFTLIELVFVIVIIGILSAVIIPKIETNNLQEAAIQLVSHIRYTQHLAMVDDKFDSTDDEWYKKRWSIRFNKDAHSDKKEAYTIFADAAAGSAGNADVSEVAKNPQNSNRLLSGGITGPTALDIREDNFAGSKELNLGKKYGIESVTFDRGCDEKHFAFDSLGRPFNGRFATYDEAYISEKLIETKCLIILKDAYDVNVTIVLEPETGYAYILRT